MQGEAIATSKVASFPESCLGEEERQPGTHCLRMRQVPLVTCIPWSISVHLLKGRILPVGHIMAVLKSKTTRFDGNGLHCFVRGDRLT